MIEHVVRVNMLLDFYAPLLTEKQRFVLEMYYAEDLSLVEIAENLSISRQAVYDLLHRGESALNDYESRLCLVEKHLKRQAILQQALTHLHALQTNPSDEATCAHLHTLLTQLKQ